MDVIVDWSGRRTRRCVICVSATFFLMLSILSIAQPGSADAFVNGEVIDSGGNPLEGANVTVNIWSPGKTQINGTLWCDATTEEGYYQVFFGGIDGYAPKVNDVIEVIAKYLSEPEAKNESVITEISYSYRVNVTVGTILIPEFGIGQSVGLPLAILGIVAILVVMGRRRTR